MAAGMGSRFGGCKQVKPIDLAGHTILDFSVYDAMRAGFGAVYFIIKERDAGILSGRLSGIGSPNIFRSAMCSKKMKIFRPVFSCPRAQQAVGHRPRAFCLPKPGEGTFRGHQCGRLLRFRSISGNIPFFYRKPRRHSIWHGGIPAKTPCRITELFPAEFAGSIKMDRFYRLSNISISGGRDSKFCLPAPDGRRVPLLPDHTVSMNFWGLSDSIFPFLEQGLARFLSEQDSMGLCRNEYYLPSLISELIEQSLLLSA